MTEQQINELNLNPLIQLISAVSGVPVNDLISEIQIKKEDIKNEPVVKEGESVSDDVDKLYPLTKEDIVVIVQALFDLNASMHNLENLGIDIWNSELGDSIYNFIDVILGYIHEDLPWIYRDIDWTVKDANEIAAQIIDDINNE